MGKDRPLTNNGQKANSHKQKIKGKKGKTTKKAGPSL